MLSGGASDRTWPHPPVQGSTVASIVWGDVFDVNKVWNVGVRTNFLLESLLSLAP